MVYDEEVADRLRAALSSHVSGAVTERRMFGGICFLREGNMVAGVNHSDVMVRVGPELYERALRLKSASKVPEKMNMRTMKGMVWVNNGPTQKALGPFLSLANDFRPPPKQAKQGKKATKTKTAKKATRGKSPQPQRKPTGSRKRKSPATTSTSTTTTPATTTTTEKKKKKKTTTKKEPRKAGKGEKPVQKEMAGEPPTARAGRASTRRSARIRAAAH